MTGYGYITDVCLKRKIRNFVELAKEGKSGYNILVKPDKALNTRFTEAYDAEHLEKGKKGKKADDVKKARDYMCRNYSDVRMLSEQLCQLVIIRAVSSECPVQITFARSLSQINIEDVTITRQARTTEDRQETGGTEMGSKKHYTICSVPCRGIYIGCISAEGDWFIGRMMWSFYGMLL